MTYRFATLALLCASLLAGGCRMCANCEDYCAPVVEVGPDRCDINYRKNSILWNGGMGGYEMMPGEVIESPEPEPALTPIPQPGSVHRGSPSGRYSR